MRTLDWTSQPLGTKATGLLSPIPDVEADLPYTIVRGITEGATLVVTAGVHGAEYASIEAARRVAAIDPSRLSGTLVVLPIVNPPAFFARSIYVNPIDGKNLNRVFPGRPDGTFAERLAHWLTSTCIAHADAYVDLHGGDMIESLTPFSIHHGDHAPSQTLAEAFGLPLLVAGGGGSGTTYAAATAHGVPAVLAEAGGQGQWPEEAIELLVQGTQRVMQHLGMLEGVVEVRETRVLRTFAWLRSRMSGLWYPSVDAGDAVEAGQEVGVVTDLLGDVEERRTSPQDGVVLFAVNSLAINENDPLIGIGA